MIVNKMNTVKFRFEYFVVVFFIYIVKAKLNGIDRNNKRGEYI